MGIFFTVGSGTWEFLKKMWVQHRFDDCRIVWTNNVKHTGKFGMQRRKVSDAGRKRWSETVGIVASSDILDVRIDVFIGRKLRWKDQRAPEMLDNRHSMGKYGKRCWRRWHSRLSDIVACQYGLITFYEEIQLNSERQYTKQVCEC